MNKNKKRYMISVPFVVDKAKPKKEDMLECLEKAKADYVFLSFETVSASMEKNREKFKLLSEYIPFLKSHGFKVGVWVWSFWLTELNEAGLENDVMVKFNGEKRLEKTLLNSSKRISSGFFCPTSEKASGIMLDALKLIASYQPDIILFDDDFDYGTHNGCIGCFCPEHIRLFAEETGENISLEQLKAKLFEGKTNSVRRAWYSFTGSTLEAYAARVRQAVDEINPEIRVGLCSVMAIWGTDGTTAERIAKILAGNTRAFIRLIGAPYWANTKAWGNRLQNIIELERMEYAWLEDKDGIDVFTEGDCYPRPRYTTPASYLECFDTALRAAGVANGIHKYMFDYTSAPHYEPGYLQRHMKNAELYEAIERIFSDKQPVGVRVYEAMDKISQADVTGIKEPNGYLVNQFHSVAARMLSDSCVPTVYEGNPGVGIAFGENARELPDGAFSGGLLLDIRAAKILMEQGIDVGIESIGDKKLDNLLYYPAEDDVTVTAYADDSAYRIVPKENAQTVVYSLCGEEKYADVIHYVNGQGTRFAVFSFDAQFTDERRYRSYYAQNQLFRSVQWLWGKKMSAECKGNPDLYMLTCENEKEFAVGLWNIFPDIVYSPRIELNREYKAAEFVNCSGELLADSIVLSDIQPYSTAIVNLKK